MFEKFFNSIRNFFGAPPIKTQFEDMILQDEVKKKNPDYTPSHGTYAEPVSKQDADGSMKTQRKRDEERSNAVAEFFELIKQMKHATENGTYLEPLVLEYYSTRLDTIMHKFNEANIGNHSKPVNDQITDSVTAKETKPKKPRAPRKKKSKPDA